MPFKNAQIASLKRKAGRQAGKHNRAEKAARAALANPAPLAATTAPSRALDQFGEEGILADVTEDSDGEIPDGNCPPPQYPVLAFP